MGKIINFGSLNIDWVYRVPHFVGPGETLSAEDRQRFAGGKGLNQSLAAARAGAQVLHVGRIGPDGGFLRALLEESKVDTHLLLQTQSPTGHTVIQVTPQGENAILVLQGANGCFTLQEMEQALEAASPGDWVLVQNEINLVPQLIQLAHSRGLQVAFNPSPMPQDLQAYPLDLVDLFLLNRGEAARLAGREGSPQALLDHLRQTYPGASLVLTLGSQGVLYRDARQTLCHAAYPTQAVDTTGAGDTFCGYFLAASLQGRPVADGLALASMAASIAISRPGAAPSIPVLEEVLRALSRQGTSL